LGPDHLSTVTVASLLGVTLVEQRKYVEGETVLRRAVQGFEKDAAQRTPAQKTPSVDHQHATAAVELGLALYGQKRHAEAEIAFQAALRLAGRVPSPDPGLDEKARLFLGDSLTELWRPAEGEFLLRRALESAETNYGPQGAGVGIVLWRLGESLAAQQKYAEAAAVLGRALAIYDGQPTTGRFEGHAADIAGARGRALLRQGDHIQAQPLLQRHLDFVRERMGPTDIATQNAARDLAQCLQALNKPDEAREVLRRHGIDPGTGNAAEGVRPDTLRAAMEKAADRHVEALPADAVAEVTRGAQAYSERRYAESESAHRRGLQLAQQTVGAAHPATALCEVYLGDSLIEQRRYAEAEPHLRRAIDVQEELLDRQQPKAHAADRLLLVRNRLRLGLALYGQRKPEDTVAAFTRGLNLADDLGFDDPGVAASRMYLGEVLFSREAYVRAEDQFRRAVATFKNYREPEDRDRYRRAQSGVARSLFERRRYADAVPLLQRSVDVSEKVAGLGPTHRATLNLVWSLGVSLHHSGRREEAEAMFRRGLAGAEKGLGPRDVETADFAKWLGINLRAQTRPAEAEPYFRQALAIYRAAAPRHVVTANAGVEHAGVLEALGRHEEAAQVYREAVGILEGLGASERKDLEAARQGLARALRAAGRASEADAMERKVPTQERDTAGSR
jgi:tetratricopeptide (TPR) repeat protein